VETQRAHRERCVGSQLQHSCKFLVYIEDVTIDIRLQALQLGLTADCRLVKPSDHTHCQARGI
jgi:hypothetical protein